MKRCTGFLMFHIIAGIFILTVISEPTDALAASMVEYAISSPGSDCNPDLGGAAIKYANCSLACSDLDSPYVDSYLDYCQSRFAQRLLCLLK